MFSKPIFKLAFGFLCITYILYEIGFYFNLYTSTNEFDSLVHFVAGITVSLSVLWFYFYSGFFSPTNRKYTNFFLISISGIIFMAFSWESFELVGGIMKVSMPWYFYDTTLDITFGILGAIVGCIYVFNQERKWIQN